MPCYFFDIHDGNARLDDLGAEFSSLAEVRKEAMRILPDIARGRRSRRTGISACSR